MRQEISGSQSSQLRDLLGKDIETVKELIASAVSAGRDPRELETVWSNLVAAARAIDLHGERLTEPISLDPRAAARNILMLFREARTVQEVIAAVELLLLRTETPSLRAELRELIVGLARADAAAVRARAFVQ